MAQDRRVAQEITPGAAERRQYNRRTGSSDPSPPYFEVFERIAVALEDIGEALAPQSSQSDRESAASPATSQERMPSPRTQ